MKWQYFPSVGIKAPLHQWDMSHYGLVLDLAKMYEGRSRAALEATLAVATATTTTTTVTTATTMFRQQRLLPLAMLLLLCSSQVAAMSLDRLALERNELPATESESKSETESEPAATAVVVDDMKMAAVPASGQTDMYMLVPETLASQLDDTAHVQSNTIETESELLPEQADMLMLESEDTPAIQLLQLPSELNMPELEREPETQTEAQADVLTMAEPETEAEIASPELIEEHVVEQPVQIVSQSAEQTQAHSSEEAQLENAEAVAETSTDAAQNLAETQADEQLILVPVATEQKETEQELEQDSSTAATNESEETPIAVEKESELTLSQPEEQSTELTQAEEQSVEQTQPEEQSAEQTQPEELSVVETQPEEVPAEDLQPAESQPEAVETVALPVELQEQQLAVEVPSKSEEEQTVEEDKAEPAVLESLTAGIEEGLSAAISELLPAELSVAETVLSQSNEQTQVDELEQETPAQPENVVAEAETQTEFAVPAASEQLVQADELAVEKVEAVAAVQAEAAQETQEEQAAPIENETETKAENESEAEVVAVAQSAAEVQTVAEVPAEAVASSEAQVQTEAEIPAQAEVQTEAEVPAQAETAAAAQPEEELQAEAELETVAQTAAEAQTPAEAEAQAVAQGEAELPAEVAEKEPLNDAEPQTSEVISPPAQITQELQIPVVVVESELPKESEQEAQKIQADEPQAEQHKETEQSPLILADELPQENVAQLVAEPAKQVEQSMLTTIIPLALPQPETAPMQVIDSVLNYVNASFMQQPEQELGELMPAESTNAHLRRYDGAQVWRIVVQTDKDKKMADELQSKYDGQLWKEVKQEVDYLLKPQVLQAAERHIRAANLSRIVLIDNLQQVIEVENPPAEKIAELQNRKGHRLTWQAYHRLEDIHGFIDYMAKTYPDICSTETIGYSVEKRPLKILKISNGNARNPGIWIDGGMHAREWISPATVSFIANQLVEGWEDLPEHMRNINWYIHPVANPDGYEYSHTTDRLWRKNMRAHGRQCPGVDLNRNFGYKWGGKGTSASPCSQTYRGSKAFSEPETFYISKFISGFPRETFQAYLSFHSYGQYILYPWGYDYHLTKDRADLDRVARQAGSIITKSSGVKYTVGSSATTLYPAAGGSDDWAKGIAGIKYAYTIEMGDTGRYGFVLPAQFIPYNGKDGYTFADTVARAITQGRGTKDSRRRRAR